MNSTRISQAWLKVAESLSVFPTHTLTLLFSKTLGGHNSYFGGHWYLFSGLLVKTPLGFKTRVDSLVKVYVLHLPKIYLRCNTCWPLGGQCGSQADLFHIPVNKHWWGSKLRPIMPQTNTLLTELCWFGSHSWLFGINGYNSWLRINGLWVSNTGISVFGKKGLV